MTKSSAALVSGQLREKRQLPGGDRRLSQKQRGTSSSSFSSVAAGRSDFRFSTKRDQHFSSSIQSKSSRSRLHSVATVQVQLSHFELSKRFMKGQQYIKLNYMILALAGINTLFAVVSYSMKKFPFGSRQLQLDFSNLPLSIFGGGIISAVFAWGGGGLGLTRVQKKTLCLVSFVCYVGCATCCATCIGIEIHGAQVWRRKIMGRVILYAATLQSISLILLFLVCLEAARHLWCVLSGHYPLFMVSVFTLVSSAIFCKTIYETQDEVIHSQA